MKYYEFFGANENHTTCSYGNPMEILCKSPRFPMRQPMEISWISYRNPVETLWNPHSIPMEIQWIFFGIQKDFLWKPQRFPMEI